MRGPRRRAPDRRRAPPRPGAGRGRVRPAGALVALASVGSWLAVWACAGGGELAPLPPGHPADPLAGGETLAPPPEVLALDGAPAPVTPAADHAHAGPGTDDPVLGPAEEAPPGAELGVVGGGHDHDAPAPDPDAPDAPAGRYVCPMHPHVTADEPGARCPECGMALVPRREAARPPR